jgi:hypothetical protein
MRIAGAAVRERPLRILDGVSGFVEAIHGEDQSVEIFAARGFHTLDFIDVTRRVTSMNGPERAGEICRDGVAIVVFQQAKCRRVRRMIYHRPRPVTVIVPGCATTDREKCRRDNRAGGEETKCGFHVRSCFLSLLKNLFLRQRESEIFLLSEIFSFALRSAKLRTL